MNKSGMMWKAGIGLSIMMTMVLTGLFPAGARAAGENPALIVATNQLTLPTNGTVSVTVTESGGGTPKSFNLFQYTTVSNYNVARWTVALPPSKLGGLVLNDTVGKLVYLQYRAIVGTVISVR